MPRNIKVKRKRLFELDPHCHYCGCEVIWFDLKEGVQPDNAATIDHFYSKSHPLYKKVPQEYYLACRKCNNERGKIDQETYKWNDFFTTVNQCYYHHQFVNFSPS